MEPEYKKTQKMRYRGSIQDPFSPNERTEIMEVMKIIGENGTEEKLESCR